MGPKGQEAIGADHLAPVVILHEDRHIMLVECLSAVSLPHGDLSQSGGYELVELEKDWNKARSRRKPQPVRLKPVTIGDLIWRGNCSREVIAVTSPDWGHPLSREKASEAIILIALSRLWECPVILPMRR
jgi:hypothetical protein